MGCQWASNSYKRLLVTFSQSRVISNLIHANTWGIWLNIAFEEQEDQVQPLRNTFPKPKPWSPTLSKRAEMQLGIYDFYLCLFFLKVGVMTNLFYSTSLYRLKIMILRKYFNKPIEQWIHEIAWKYANCASHSQSFVKLPPQVKPGSWLYFRVVTRRRTRRTRMTLT